MLTTATEITNEKVGGNGVKYKGIRKMKLPFKCTINQSLLLIFSNKKTGYYVLTNIILLSLLKSLQGCLNRLVMK